MKNIYYDEGESINNVHQTTVRCHGYHAFRVGCRAHSNVSRHCYHVLDAGLIEVTNARKNIMVLVENSKVDIVKEENLHEKVVNMGSM